MRLVIERPRRRGVVLVGVVCLVLSACGSRLPHSTVLAENAVVVQPVAAGVGATVSPGSVATLDPGATPTTSLGAGLANGAGATSTIGPGAASTNDGARNGTGGSTNSTGGSSDSGSRDTNGPATGSVVNVGEIGLYSGLLGSLLGTVKAGTQVAVAYLNAHGGLGGHRINLITADDGGNPATSLADAQQMINQDHVIAFLNELNPLSSKATFTYIQQQGVPIIGGVGVEPDYYDLPGVFPGTSSPRIQSDISVKAGIDKGYTKVGILYCAEFSVLCSTNATYVQHDAPKFGGQVVFDQQVSLAQPDYTSQCLSAKAAGVTNFFLTLDPNSVLRLTANCAQQGFHPHYSTLGVVLDAPLTQTSNTNGMVGGAADFPFSLVSPATAAFRQAFQQATGGPPTSNLEASAWVGGLILQAASRDLPANPTGADVIAGLHKIKDDNFGGLAPSPITYTPGRATPTSTCAFIVEITNGKFTAPDGLTPTCLPASFAN